LKGVAIGRSAERASAVDFSAPYMEVEQGYLVRPGASIATASDVDKTGIRIAVIEKAGADLHLSSTTRSLRRTSATLSKRRKRQAW
jgi:polar amino acid transport system substrate-binding protein